MAVDFTEVGYWALYATAIVFAMGLWLGRRIAQRRSGIVPDLPGATPMTRSIALADSAAPTVRLNDAQRMDRLRRTITLKAGEHSDLLDRTFDGVPRLRITFVDFESPESDTVRARLHVDFGGAVASCGSLATELGPNQFMVPCAPQHEQRSSITHFYGANNVVNLLRIKVAAIDKTAGSVNVDVLHVCSRWGA
jgi:hypothetical protein